MKGIGHTKRIILREAIEQDAQIFYDLNSDPEVIKYTGDPAFHSVNDAKHFLIKYDHYNKYQRGRWLLCNKMNNEILGWCGLKFHEDSKETDIGYRLFRKHWNLGYATESSHLALQYGFRRLGLDSIIARAAKANIASLKVMQKLGLDYEREFEEHGNIFEQHRIDKYNYMLWADNNNNIVVY